LLGDYAVVRENRRVFGQTEHGLFRAIALIVLDVETFYTDLANQYEDHSFYWRMDGPID